MMKRFLTKLSVCLCFSLLIFGCLIGLSGETKKAKATHTSLWTKSASVTLSNNVYSAPNSGEHTLRYSGGNVAGLNTAEMTFRYQNSSGDGGSCYVSWQVYINNTDYYIFKFFGNIGYTNPVCGIFKNGSNLGSNYTLTRASYTYNQWITMKITLYNSNASMYINGTRILQYNAAVDSSLTWSKVQVNTYALSCDYKDPIVSSGLVKDGPWSVQADSWADISGVDYREYKKNSTLETIIWHPQTSDISSANVIEAYVKYSNANSTYSWDSIINLQVNYSTGSGTGTYIMGLSPNRSSNTPYVGLYNSGNTDSAVKLVNISSGFGTVSSGNYIKLKFIFYANFAAGYVNDVKAFEYYTGISSVTWTKAGVNTFKCNNSYIKMASIYKDVFTMYSVTYNMNGGTNSSNNTTAYSYGSTYSFTNPTKTGYNFGGWYTNAGLTTSFSSITSTTSGNLILYAKWTGITYYVRYNGNTNTSGSMSNSTHTYGTSSTLTANAFVKTGYHFIGWATSAGGAKVYNDQHSISTLTTTSGATVDLYAKWEINTYTVSFAISPAGYGSVSSSSIASVPYGTSISVSNNTVTINGSTVTATAASATAQYTYAFSSWSNTSGTVTAARTITANFTRSTRTYTVTVAVNTAGYGTVSASSVASVPYGTTITTNGSAVTINGTTVTATPTAVSDSYTYYFSSWTNGTATVNGALTVTANFTRVNNYVVTVGVANAGYGSVSTTSITRVPSGTAYSTSGNVLTVSKATPVTSTATPTTATAQYTYAFSSWSSTSGTITANTTINASFTRTVNNYTVTVAVNTAGYGTVSASSVASVPYGTTITTNGSAVTINGTTVTATPTAVSDSYTYYFSSWTNGTATVNGALTVTANFTRVNNYVVTVGVANAGYGSVSTTSITRVPSGTAYSTSGNVLTVSKSPAATSTATPTTATAQYTYAFSSWSSTSGTITANTTINASFTRTVNNYTVTIGVAAGSTDYGSVSTTSVASVPYGTSYSTSGNVLTVSKGTPVTSTASPIASTAQYTYAFSSWSSTSGTVTGDLTIKASFTRTTNQYTVSVLLNNANYGTLSSTSVTVDYGTSISTSSNILTVGATEITASVTDKTGYTTTFSSWTNASGTVTADRNITANFTRTAKTYTVTKTSEVYGSITAESTGTFDSSLSISWTSEGTSGYSYDFTSLVIKDGSGNTLATIDDGTSTTYTMTTTYYSEIKLYLTYDRDVVDYTITYYLYSGSNGTNPSGYNVEDEIELETPFKTGYHFAGWFTEDTFDNLVTGITLGSTGDKSFYAKWETPQNSASLSVGGEVKNNLYVDIEAYTKNSSAYVTLTYNHNNMGYTPDISTDTYYLEDLEDFKQDDGTYKFSMGFASGQINETVDIYLYDSDDTLLWSKTNYSIRDYCLAIIKSSDDDNLVNLCKTMIFYGSYAQQLFNYNTENLATDGLDKIDGIVDFTDDIEDAISDLDYTDIKTNKDIDNGISEMTIGRKAAFIALDTSSMYFYYTLDGLYNIEDYDISVSGGMNYRLGSDSDGTYIEIYGIQAVDLDTVFTITVTDDVNTSTVTYSVLDFARRRIQTESSTSVRCKFYKLLYLYNVAAHAYFD